MAYQVLERAAEIEQVREKIITAFRNHGQNWCVRTWGSGARTWTSGYCDWKTSVSDLLLPRPSGNRYWNAFGTKDPSRGSVPITCEINLPLMELTGVLVELLWLTSRGALFLLIEAGSAGDERTSVPSCSGQITTGSA